MKLHAIEINISEICNLKCKGCDHGLDQIENLNISFEKIRYYIRKISKNIRVSTIRIIGGEPLLHSELSKIIFEIYNSNVAETIELWTNGILLKDVSKENWEYLDRVIISIYPGVTYSWNKAWIVKFAYKYNIFTELRECKHFQWSIIAKKKNHSLTNIIYNTCKERNTCTTLRNGRIYKCVQAAFALDRLKDYKIKYCDDGIDIDDIRLKHRLKKYFESKEPLNTCYYCLGEYGASFKHEQSENKVDLLKEPRFTSNVIIPE